MTGRGPGAPTVLYDGRCPLCRRSVALLKRLDWLGRLRYADARDPAALGAVRRLAWQLPALWPAAPLLYLPGVPQLGQRLYLWVAKNRFHLVPCHDGECQVPQRKRDLHHGGAEGTEKDKNK
jgi:predicted DCC family thiol-disulfide oxidoreductase YuxK